MKRLALFAALFLPASSAHCGATLDGWGVVGISGGYHYYGSQTEVSSPVGTGIYSLSARIRTIRLGDLTSGTQEEYSAQLRKELYHVYIAGRLGTAPPNNQRAEYHLAQGEAICTFYGLTLGPLHPELSAQTWESKGPLPPPDSLDRTWVTIFHGIYTNTNLHLERPTSILVVVENSWQFELRETWRERTSLSLQMGFDHYNRTLVNSAETVLLNNIDYPGNLAAIRGWPNNYAAAEIGQKVGRGLRLSAAFTRLNLLNNQLLAIYGAGLEWDFLSHWRVRPQYFYRRRRYTNTQQGVALGISYIW